MYCLSVVILKQDTAVFDVILPCIRPCPQKNLLQIGLSGPFLFVFASISVQQYREHEKE